VAVAALVGTVGVVSASAAPPARSDASAIILWNEVAVTTLGLVPAADGGFRLLSR